MSWVGWAIAIGGPLLGIGAVMALAVAHEHARLVRRLPVRLPESPRPVRRASTALLEDYLSDEREASPAQRRRRHERLLLQARRASTDVFEEFFEERIAAPTSDAVERVPLQVRTPVDRPVDRPIVRRPVPVFERAARPTRLVPLGPEIAIN
ncbi:MAG TPA: hypothetical protein VFX49_23560 [Chloroflexota bacterium]|nr:hypothetical protein [Chloroflexota bacterium]